MRAPALAGLLLALSASGPVFPTLGTGFFEQLLSDVHTVSWSLGGVTTSDVRNTGVGPGPCTAICGFDFSVASVALPFALVPGYAMVPRMSFSGPRVVASAVCPGLPACLPGSRLFQTVWGSVPITMSGMLRFVSTSDPTDIVEIAIIGRGTATAENRVELGGTPRSDSRTRYEFTYEVVPEPEGIVLTATGLLILTAVRRRRNHLERKWERQGNTPRRSVHGEASRTLRRPAVRRA
jgi:hypothetical protein